MGQFIVSYGKFANEKDRGPVGAPHDVSEKTQHVKLARKVLKGIVRKAMNCYNALSQLMRHGCVRSNPNWNAKKVNGIRKTLQDPKNYVEVQTVPKFNDSCVWILWSIETT